MVDTKKFVKEAEEKMESAILYLDEQLARIRAGKANPKILDGIRVPYYGESENSGWNSCSLLWQYGSVK